MQKDINNGAQHEIILTHLKRFKRGVTLQVLRNKYDIRTPNARISELIADGWFIEKKWQPVELEGRRSREMVYQLKSNNKGVRPPKL